MTTLYIDAFGGVAGDMLLAGLCDLGFDLGELRPLLRALELRDKDLRVTTVRRGALACKRVEVLASELDGHDHDRHDHDDGHHHAHDHEPHHGHHHAPAAPHEHHGHRAYSEIRALIAQLPFEAPVIDHAQNALTALARAEAKIHGIDIEHVHFHEVGAADSIVDIVGVCVGLEKLGVRRVLCSALPIGRGFVDCAHGRLPLPAPATLELLAGIPTYDAERDGEHVTPTAAALISTLVKDFGPRPPGTVRRVGYGAGSRDDHHAVPNALRLILMDDGPDHTEVHSVMVEAGIDDMSPQFFPPLSERLSQAGAVDVCALSCLGKKGRPAVLLRLVVSPDCLDAVADVLFQESSTIGLRYWNTDRIVGERSMESVETAFGTIAVKVTRRRGAVCNVQPEFRDCEAAAVKAGVPVKRVHQAAVAAAQVFWGRT